MTSNGDIGAAASMHVLHVTPCYAPAWAYGRVPQIVSDLARSQARLGHKVTVLTSDAIAPHERAPAGECVEDGVRVIRCRNLSGLVRWWLNLSTPIGLQAIARSILAREPVDVVHLHELHTVENVIVLRAVNASPAVVASTYDTLAGVNSRAWGVLLRARHLKRIDGYVAGSVFEADAIEQVYNETRQARARKNAPEPEGWA